MNKKFQVAGDLLLELLDCVPVEARDKVRRAIEFVLDKHDMQTRPGGELAIVHLMRVGLRAARYTAAEAPADTVELVQSALCHDVVEDTKTAPTEIAELFGAAVANNVAAVSHYEEEEPDEVYLSRVEQGGKNAVLTKRFDRLDNIETLVNAPADFRAKKLAEVRAALPIWHRIDPEGALEIESTLQKVEEVSNG